MTPVGCGGTFAGLISGDSIADRKQHKVLGVAVIKGAEYLIEELKSILTPEGATHKDWQLLTQFHRGDYGKFSTSDAQRIIAFNQQTGVTFVPVYSGKMILGWVVC